MMVLNIALAHAVTRDKALCSKLRFREPHDCFACPHTNRPPAKSVDSWGRDRASQPQNRVPAKVPDADPDHRRQASCKFPRTYFYTVELALVLRRFHSIESHGPRRTQNVLLGRLGRTIPTMKTTVLTTPLDVRAAIRDVLRDEHDERIAAVVSSAGMLCVSSRSRHGTEAGLTWTEVNAMGEATLRDRAPSTPSPLRDPFEQSQRRNVDHEGHAASTHEPIRQSRPQVSDFDSTLKWIVD